MSNQNSLKTWGFLIGLIIFSGLAIILWQAGIGPALPSASAAAPAPHGGQPEMIEIRIHETHALLMNIPFLAELDGAQVSPFTILGILTVITILPIAVLGGGLALALRLSDSQTTSVKESDTVQKARVSLEQREAERLKRIRKEKQPKPKPASEAMPLWSIISTSLIILLLVLFVSTMLGTYIPEDSRITPNTLNWTLIILTAASLAWLFRGNFRERLYTSDDQEEAPIPWGWLWVIVSGLLIVGLGLGFSVAMLPG